ncbi:hypothetical protein NDN08_000888 [Rhodosorus marinus]|uniref:Isopropylmalate dehydrogenase-like domain-containing protein n=1 Tax=Rhodosorus marinus TaxID=101924 RepID=A0AAV8UP94_9RHOD|nr:hypothetical protein NDN08_000888 [Rhodosorus marinus]
MVLVTRLGGVSRLVGRVGAVNGSRWIHGTAALAQQGVAYNERLFGHLETSVNSFPILHTGGVHPVPVTLMPGEGIGLEVANSMIRVFEAADVPVEFERFEFTDLDEGVPDAVVASFRKNGVALKGPFNTPVKSKSKSINIILRTTFDLFANVVHCKNIPGVKTRHPGVDVVVIRENTEGEYSGLEHETVPGVVESLKIISREKSIRIAEYAFQYAERNNRKKVTAVHKANIMKQSDGLFLQCCKEVAAKYPYIEFDNMIVDNTCMQMASKPQQFDVMVMPNLYGNIITNIACGLAGGQGLFPGANFSPTAAIFEQATRHAAKSIGGMDVANPSATILAGAMMLRYLKLNEQASGIETALLEVLQDGKVLTPDLPGGKAKLSDFTKAVIAKLD